METETEPKATPFLKWVGGKTTLLDRLQSILPTKIDTYYEPFIGGGALFFELAHLQRFQKAVINDWNVELVTTYKAIRDFQGELVNLLWDHQQRYMASAETYYYEVRSQDVQSLLPVQRAARFIFLNRTGFNGLYRVNKKGQFNVPWGKYKNPTICNEVNLRACSRELSKFIRITRGDFADVVRDAKYGDAVYFDPPYVPVNKTSNFTSYTSDGFGLDDQHRLAACFRELAERGVAVVASNSDTETVRQLYDGWEMYQVQMRRNINSKGDSRGPISELVIVGRPGGLIEI